MKEQDLIFILNVLVKAIAFLCFVYLDRKSWSWKKGSCVLILLGGNYNFSYEKLSSFSMLTLLVVYVITTILVIRILNNKKEPV